jgi:5-methylcytosine-specific restriction enzyme subunit McrC
MAKKNGLIQVFEYETLRIDKGDNRISPSILKALHSFYGENGVPYYTLIHNGVRFNEYVGVFQIDGTTIEVLPKADRNDDKSYWQKMLISMLQSVGIFDIHVPSSASLQLKVNSIMDLYFELFINELEFLMHQGLVKKYRKTEANQNALKGGLNFPKHISKNIIHKERFFVNYTTYDKDHKIHQILFKALKVLNQINTNNSLNSRIGSLMLDFPEVSDIKIAESLFDKLFFDRKTISYKSAIDIAKLILMNYHPDLSKGRNDVLALMFDMNLLWEQFVYKSLYRHKKKEEELHAQHVRDFWKPQSGYKSKMKPDIVLKNKITGKSIVLDTKWKNLNGSNPSPEDLRQMFVYMKYFNANKVALIYPGVETKISSGKYFNHQTNVLGDEECSVITICVENNISSWQGKIADHILNWEKGLQSTSSSIQNA